MSEHYPAKHFKKPGTSVLKIRVKNPICVKSPTYCKIWMFIKSCHKYYDLTTSLNRNHHIFQLGLCA